MTDTDRRTEPALTAEEWRRALTRRQNARAMMDMIGEDEGAHRRAALALYGQPFGFTWEDVDVLRGVAQYERGEIPNCPPADGRRHENDAAWYDDLADRLAALLPPR